MPLAARPASLQAQPFGVNGSGAALLEALFQLTREHPRLHRCRRRRPDANQLAPFDATFPSLSSQHWQFTYRVVGSGNGFAEMRDLGTIFAVDADLNSNNLTLNSDEADAAYFNSQLFIAAGVTQGAANSDNPGATPFRTLTDGSHSITTSTGSGSGVQIDFSALDVPVAWFVLNDVGRSTTIVPGALWIMATILVKRLIPTAWKSAKATGSGACLT
ncbi:MAG: hypothetical protein R3B67_05010 [Phycisphaerales bacterium]